MILRRIGVSIGAAVLFTGLAACADSGGTEAASVDKKVTLGIIPSWTDGLSTAYLWKNVLESKDYTVKITELSEAAPLYAGLVNGDVNIYPSAWPEVTHEEYMKKYGDKIDDLGSYYSDARLTLAVPDYSTYTSIEQLKGKASVFGGKIIGIEPGAGHMKVTKDSVIPQYGLGSEYTLVESSTTAMLAELKSAIASKREIVVTLWRPFWANAEFKMKDLQDPKGALGKPEGLHALATKGWVDQHPDLKQLFADFKLTDEQYANLENKVVNEYGQGKEAQAVESWLKDNDDIAKKLKG